MVIYALSKGVNIFVFFLKGQGKLPFFFFFCLENFQISKQLCVWIESIEVTLVSDAAVVFSGSGPQWTFAISTPMPWDR